MPDDVNPKTARVLDLMGQLRQEARIARGVLLRPSADRLPELNARMARVEALAAEAADASVEAQTAWRCGDESMDPRAWLEALHTREQAEAEVAALRDAARGVTDGGVSP